MSLTCMIITKDRWDSVQRLLRSIGNQSVAPDEVIVVNDGGAELAEFKEVACLRQIRNPRSLNSGRARNIGVDAARSEVVLLLDDDCELQSQDFIEKMSAPFKDPKIAICFPTKVDRIHDQEYERSFCKINPWSGELPWISSQTAQTLQSQGLPVLGPMVCAVRRSCYLELGGYHFVFGWGLGHSFREESDFQLRLQSKFGVTAVATEPEIRFYHHVMASGGHGAQLHKRVFWIAHNQVVFSARHLSCWIFKVLGFTVLELPRYSWGNGRLTTLPAGIAGIFAGLYSAIFLDRMVSPHPLKRN